ncbi:MAG TPA: PDZ domain-containing protein [Pyrinomonadaceae bacterium]|nr:PDZ domain-containing protein [Pyrinomonadaceae bacterium]
MLYRRIKKLSLSLVMVFTVVACARAQVAPTPPSPQHQDAPVADKVTVESALRQAPQVLTIVHRLDGLRALALLRGNGETVATVDDELLTASDAVTSITAGFALGDGENVVARLPQAEALAVFQPFNMSWTFMTPPPIAQGGTPTAQTAPPAPGSAELVVVQDNGHQFTANYVGLDGGSGLSLLKIPGLSVSPPARDASEEQLAVGQTIRLFAPVRVTRRGAAKGETVSIRVGEFTGEITTITQTSRGKVVRLTVCGQNLSPEIVGGVALNEAGETVGIVETSEVGTVHLIPIAAVRRAAQRVLARRTNVPRPWLGVRGEPVAAIPLEKFHSIGWAEVDAAWLKAARKGIVLTTVVPGTPAAQADLRPGDVILRINDFEVKSAEDFSFILNEAGSGANVNFTFLRGPAAAPTTPSAPTPPTPAQSPRPAQFPRIDDLKPLEVNVKLGEAMNTARAMRLAEAYAARDRRRSTDAKPPFMLGVEVFALSAKAAAHLGARGGRLIVFIEPESAAARAGLRVFDVIESVNGKPLKAAQPIADLAGDAQQITLGVVRDRRKVEVVVKRKD